MAVNVINTRTKQKKTTL